jgi:hypothetical protein
MKSQSPDSFIQYFGKNNNILLNIMLIGNAKSSKYSYVLPMYKEMLTNCAITNIKIKVYLYLLIGLFLLKLLK